MQSIHLDCSALRSSISLDASNMPHSIYVDGVDFLNRLSQTIQQEIYLPEDERKKIFREKLIIALASNPATAYWYEGNDNYKYVDRNATALNIISQADAIITEMEKI